MHAGSIHAYSHIHKRGKQVLVRVAVFAGHNLSSSAVALQPAPDQTRFCLSRQVMGSDVCSIPPIEKESLVCAFLVNCLSGRGASHWVPFVGLYQDATVETQGCDRNPVSRLFLQLERKMELNLTSSFSHVFTSKEKLKI